MPPRHATPRNPARPTDSSSGAFIAHLHRRPWIPWQRDTAAVLGERSATGYAYPIVVVLVPRQCGKTSMIFDLAQGRCLDQVDYRAAYCAQTGHVTSERIGERMGELAATPLARRVRTRRSAGTERMSFPRGSFIKAFPPKDGALRSSALDLVVVDEAQEIDEQLGRALDQTILPTFTTRPRRQLILIGTAGTSASEYLARYLDLARTGTPGVGLIEYGATPPVEDPGDEDLWLAVHPGLAAGLTDLDALRSARTPLGDAGFTREYLNVWSVTVEQVIPHAVWSAAAAPLAKPSPGGRIVFAVDVAVDRGHAAIVACWPDRDGRPTLELVDYAPGVSWAAPRLAALAAKHRPAAVLADSAGPVATVVDDAARAGLTITTLTSREYAAACAALHDDLVDGAIQHHADPAMDVAAAGAARRPLGDAWAWGRRTSAADISPLVAGTVARWAWTHPPARSPAPLIVSG